MWLRFLVAFTITAMVMYIPGYLFWRSLRFGRILSLACGPLASISALALMGIVFQKVGVPVNGVLLVGIALAMGLLLYGISHLPISSKAVSCSYPSAIENDPLRHGPQGRHGALDLAIPDVAILALYIVCGLIVCTWVFLANIGSPDAFFSRWDNQTHLSLVRAFLDSGQWSSLRTDQYLASVPAAIPYVDEPGFYPAAWHVVVATVCSISRCGVSVGVNAVNSVFMGVVLPMSVFSFLRTSFPDNRMVVLAGAVAASGCSVFPWWFFATGPLYPNFAGMALVLASASAAIALLAGGLVRRKWVSVVLLASSSMISLALMHPNVLFYLLIVLAAYGASHLFDFQKAAGHGTAVRIAGMVVYLVVICVFWYACFRLPFLQGVIRYPSKPKPGIIPALVNLAGMVAVEPVFALAASGGFVLCCHDRRPWLAAPAVFMAMAYVASRLDPGGIGQVIGGFWYVDFRRLGSCFGFALIPLAAWGLGGFTEWIVRTVSRRGVHVEIRGEHSRLAGSRAGLDAAGVFDAGGIRRQGMGTGVLSQASTCLALAIILVIGALNLFPTFNVTVHDEVFGTGFGTFTKRIHETYDPAVEHVYSAREIAFVGQALDRVPKDALVINQPNDGSTFAYALNDMNTYYRHCRVGKQTEDSRTIRLKLVDYATDEQVRKAVKDTGAEYVLLLDQGVKLEDGVWLPQYGDSRPWEGIDSITDDTPGFSIVLADGDMRLYRIDEVT